MSEILQYLQVVQIPMVVYLVLIDKRLVRVETLLRWMRVKQNHELNVGDPEL